MTRNTRDTMSGGPALDQAYWNDRWRQRQTGWDIGAVSPAIAAYIDQYPDKDASVLIPGCGSAYEAEYFSEKGFTDITLIDIAPEAVNLLREKFQDLPQIKIVCGDFFEHRGQYDLLIEQTFFCAIPPARRREYVAKAASLLREKGRLVGVLFQVTFEKEGPPFGGSIEEYRSLTAPYFDIKHMETCYNSIPPRAGSEVFIYLIKKEK